MGLGGQNPIPLLPQAPCCTRSKPFVSPLSHTQSEAAFIYLVELQCQQQKAKPVPQPCPAVTDTATAALSACERQQLKISNSYFGSQEKGHICCISVTCNAWLWDTLAALCHALASKVYVKGPFRGPQRELVW